MSQNFLQIQKEYLQKVWEREPRELKECLPASFRGGCLYFKAFGEPCELTPQEILLGGQRVTGPEGILISLYALHAQMEVPQLHPLKSFKQFPEGMAYYGTFSAHAEKSLCPHVPILQQRREEIAVRFSGHVNSSSSQCDFSFTLYPLPKVPLYYLFYLPDEEFPASVSCLFSANATDFLPVAGLADTAEYTAKKIIQWVTEAASEGGEGLK
jgi:hypothetical protein